MSGLNLSGRQAAEPGSLPVIPPRVRQHRSYRFLIAAVLTGVSLAWVPGLSGHAAADVIDAQCAGSFTRTFSPAVTVSSQTVTAASSYSYSTCLVGATGTGAATTTLSLACVSLTAGPAETETIAWQDGAGDTSTIDWSPPVIAGQTVVFTGTVTAGLFAGDTAAKVTSGISYIGSVTQCLLNGTPISQTTGLIDSLVLTSG
jgi:hypothetical protein